MGKMGKSESQEVLGFGYVLKAPFRRPFYSVLLGCIIRVLLLFGLGCNKDSRGNGPVPGGPHRKARQLTRTADKWLTCGLCDDKGRHQALET